MVKHRAFALKILRKLRAFNMHSLAFLLLFIPSSDKIWGNILTFSNDFVNLINGKWYIIKTRITEHYHQVCPS